MPLTNAARVKNLLYAMLASTGGISRRLERLRHQNLVVVLNLHRVSPEPNEFWSPLSPAVFENLVVFLKQHFQVVLFRDLPGIRADKPIAILSFDDGYEDFVEHAMPILERHDIRANLNIIPSCVETGKAIWNVQLYDFLQAASATSIEDIRLPAFSHRLAGDDKRSKMQYGLKISAFLKNRSRSERRVLWARVAEVINAAKHYERTRMMTAADVIAASKVHEIGVHSFDHDSMGFEEDDYFLADFDRCRRYFQQTLGLPLDIYAFPNGSYRPGQVSALQANSVRHILLVDEAFTHPDRDVHPRFTVYGETAAEMKLIALGCGRTLTRCAA